jgi:uncharacterized protein (TIGR02217 family)
VAVIFPTLPGLTYSTTKSPQFKTKTQKGVSGRELRLTYQPVPTWLFKLRFDFLRGLGPKLYKNKFDELRVLMGLFMAQQGSLSPFLFNDETDNYIAMQPIGVGNGTFTAFQLVRTMTYYGGTSFTEPILAPNVIEGIYVNGLAVTDYTVNIGTGVVTFTTAPPNNASITATFSFYFICRFADDTEDFEQFMRQLWTLQELKLQSVLL